MQNLFEEVEIRGEGGGLIGGVIVLAVAAVVVFQFAYPTVEAAILSISDPTNATLAGLALLALVLTIVFGGLRLAGVV